MPSAREVICRLRAANDVLKATVELLDRGACPHCAAMARERDMWKRGCIQSDADVQYWEALVRRHAQHRADGGPIP